MKKFISCMLALVMVLGIMSVGVMAADPIVFDSFDYADLPTAKTQWSTVNALIDDGNGGKAIQVNIGRTATNAASYYKGATTVTAGDYTISFRVKTESAYDGDISISFMSSSSNVLFSGAVTSEWSTVSGAVTWTNGMVPRFKLLGPAGTAQKFIIDDLTFTPVTSTPDPEPTEFAVTISGDAGAKVSVAAATSEGEAVDFTVAPKFGYYIAGITVGGTQFPGFEAYKGGTYSTGAIAADTAIVVTTASLADNTDANVSTDVATLPAVFAESTTAVTFGKVLDTTNAESWGVELTKGGVGVTPYHGGSYLYQANATSANGQYAIEFIGLEAGTYQIRSYVYVNGTPEFGAPATFVVAE